MDVLSFFKSEVVWLSKYLRCRSIGSVSRDWVGLPPDFHWAENSDEPQSSQFSQQRLRDFLTIECSQSGHSIVDLSLLSVAQRKIFRKPHPIPAYVTLCTAAWILANSAYGKLVAIHILSGEQIRLRFCRYQMYTEHILKPNSRHNRRNVLIDRYDIF